MLLKTPSIRLKVPAFLLPTLVTLVTALFSCKKTDIQNDLEDQKSESALVATKWADMTLYTLRHAKYNSPTYSSRSLAYLGVTMYETVVHADTAMRSLGGQLGGLAGLPVPETASYYWPLALNAGQQAMLKYLYPLNLNVSAELQQSIDSLYGAILQQKSAGISQAVIDRSVLYGRQVAAAVYEWSKTDGGNNGFLKPFEPSFIFPQGPGYWVPPLRGQTVTNFPLHPHWGSNRTMIPADSLLPTPVIMPYSTDPASAYYKMYKDVYEKNKVLTDEEKNIAAWWADDPTETYSPPGHSYNLATLTVKKANANIVKAAQTYARVGLAVADAFICCWKTKFIFFNERPATYVKANIDPNWSSFWPEPPFPAFPSGHSTQSAATATVLAGMYGDNFSFVDNTHEGARRFPFFQPMKPRSYSTFWQTAEESAYSRYLGGIHTAQDNTVGLAEGKKIGTNVNALAWTR